MSEFPTKEWRGVGSKMIAVTCGAAICDNAVIEAEREGQKKGLRKAIKKCKFYSSSTNHRVLNYLTSALKKLDVSR